MLSSGYPGKYVGYLLFISKNTILNVCSISVQLPGRYFWGDVVKYLFINRSRNAEASARLSKKGDDGCNNCIF